MFLCVLDIDDCASVPGLCEGGKCINTIGAFVCECSEGFTLIESTMKCLDERKDYCYDQIHRGKYKFSNKKIILHFE